LKVDFSTRLRLARTDVFYSFLQSIFLTDFFLTSGCLVYIFIVDDTLLTQEKNMAYVRTIPWFLWPIAVVLRLIELILIVTGRILGIILSLGLMIVGIALTIIVNGAVIGIPIAILGLLLMVRSIF
jgi:hypothetical protein